MIFEYWLIICCAKMLQEWNNMILKMSKTIVIGKNIYDSGVNLYINEQLW